MRGSIKSPSQHNQPASYKLAKVCSHLKHEEATAAEMKPTAQEEEEEAAAAGCCRFNQVSGCQSRSIQRTAAIFSTRNHSQEATRRQRVSWSLSRCGSSSPTMRALTFALLLLTCTSFLKPATSRSQSSADSLLRSKRQLNHAQLSIEQLEAQQQQPHFEPLEAPEPEAGASGARQPQVQIQQQQQQRGKRTLYACEERPLHIECQLGEAIQLIRAIYGRFSIGVCNENATVDLKVNCMSRDSFDIIAASCQAKQSCQLLASNSVFGDPCPETQKYLEVHYQCVPFAATSTLPTLAATAAAAAGSTTSPSLTNRSISNGPRYSSSPATLRIPNQSNKPSVIHTQQELPSSPLNHQHHHLNNANNHQQATNSETSQLGRLNPPATPNSLWSLAADQSRPGPALPSWMTSAVPTQHRPAPQLPQLFNQTTTTSYCPETVWRQIRWPATPAGQLAWAPCPSHAQSGAPADPEAASFACLSGGRWAPRVSAARCQSLWLRNLTQRLDVGDSPLSVLGELAARTRPAPATPLQQHAAWPATPGLFGDDLLQVGRVVRRLVDERLADLLNQIGDDKQRVTFAREMVQSLVEFVNNLAHEQQLDAWMDLAPVQVERQRLAGQLVQSLESAAVLLAGALNNGSPATSPAAHLQGHPQSQQQQQQEAFVKVTENAYVAIRSLELPQATANHSTPLQVTFPSESSTLATSWMDAEQRFTLHLQASQAVPAATSGSESTSGDSPKQTNAANAQVDNEPGQTLKIVFVMIRALGAQMEPSASSSLSGDQTSRVVVNSNLVSLSIVADSRYKYAPVKVDLSAPIELLFRHLNQQLNQRAGSIGQERVSDNPRCVYWDNNISDWLSDGCKLVATNRTHSTCACSHLTTFGLLADSFDLSLSSADVQWSQVNDGGQNPNQNNQQHQHEPSMEKSGAGEQPKVQLDGVENDQLILPNKMLYLAKMLDGHLFDSTWQSQPPLFADRHQPQSSSSSNLRLLIYICCLLSAALLVLYLAAAAYCRAHARRLLGAIPRQPPPPLLVSNHRPRSQHLDVHSGTSAAHSPSYSSSDYSAALTVSKNKLQQQQQRLAGIGSAPHLPLEVSGGSGSGASCCKDDTRATKRIHLPAHLALQLLGLQILLVLLVESQNYLQRRSYTPPVSAATAAFFGPQPLEPTTAPLDPIGPLSWLLVLTLYYLVASITCWLFSRLLNLNLELLAAGSAQRQVTCCSYLGGGGSGDSCSADSSTDKTISSINGVAHCHQQPPPASNLYGLGGYAASNPQTTGALPTTLHSSTSPTSSFSSTGVQSSAATLSDPQHHQNQQNHHTALSRLQEDHSSRLYSLRPPHHKRKQSSSRLLSALASRAPQVHLALAHLLPVLLIGLVAWCSFARASSLNSLAYLASGLGAQLVCWPLLVDLSVGSFAFVLYYLPIVCLLLAGSALFLARRQEERNGDPQQQREQVAKGVNPYGSSALVMANSQQQQQQQPLSQVDNFRPVVAAAKKQAAAADNHRLHYSAAYQCSLASQCRQAKFLAATLLALLALHSLCWISFFAHIHLALNTPPPTTAGNHHSSNHLLCAFALSDLMLVLLLTWWQRRTLRRAAHLAGMSRLLACLRRASSDRSTKRRRARFYRQQQQSAGAAVAGKPGGQVKVSASSQSLFLVSQNSSGSSSNGVAAAAAGSHHQAAYGQHHLYGGASNYAGQQQHLYQTLGQPAGHIYDSTSALNLTPEQQHLNVMQLLHQQQHQRQVQQHNFTLSLLQQRRLQQQQQQFSLDAQRTQPMTLKPSALLELDRQVTNNNDSAQLMSLDQPGNLNNNKQSGEADGPLVALSSGSGSITNNNNNHHQHTCYLPTQTANSSNGDNAATFGPNLTNSNNNHCPATTPLASLATHLTEPQLFSQQLHQHQQPQFRSQSPSPINCISQQQQQQHFPQRTSRCHTSASDANHHQYYSIGQLAANNHRPSNQSNYTDALKAAMQQQQQQQQNESAVQQHFRLRDPKQQQRHRAMIDRQVGANSGSNGNIYDVANYTLSQ